MKTSMKIKQDQNAPVPQEVIASAIITISNSMKRINQTNLSRRAIITLICTDTKLGYKTVETVLNSLETMETTWLKPKRKN